jgi:hypothetical protein
MSAVIEFIVITLCTNIENAHAPSGSYGTQTFKEPAQNIDFTSSMLTYDKPAGESLAPLTKYPFFTQDVRYDSSVLLIFPYHKLVEIFFNEDSFRTLLINRLPQTDIDSMSPEKLQELRFENGRKNVMTMLFALFTTAYPIKSDISESISQLSYKWSEEKLLQLFYDIAVKADTFSYLTIHSKLYTVKRAVWLNDVLNHPRYRTLLEEFRRFTIRMNDVIDRKRRQLGVTSDRGKQAALNDELKRIKDVLDGTDLKDLAQEFPAFSSYLTKFRKSNPSREVITTNVVLQDMIDSPELSEIFTFLRNIYQYYILGKGQTNPYNEYSSSGKSFNTGVMVLNQKNSNDPAFRIYVLMDLVEGKLTSDIVKQVDCQFNDVDLARELRILTMKQNDTFYWEVDRNRMFYKLSEKTDAKTNEKRYELAVKPFINKKNKINYSAAEFDQEQFLEWIFRTDYDESKKANEMLKYMHDTFKGLGFSEFTVLDVINRKYPDFYRAILGWNMTSDRTDPGLISNLRNIRRDIEMEKSELERKGSHTAGGDYDYDLVRLVYSMTLAMSKIESAKSTRQQRYGGRRSNRRKYTKRRSLTIKKRGGFSS